MNETGRYGRVDLKGISNFGDIHFSRLFRPSNIGQPIEIFMRFCEGFWLAVYTMPQFDNMFIPNINAMRKKRTEQL